jgi:hypothetical protein
MGFDRKTPKPGKPINEKIIHKHKYWNYSKKRWMEETCWCATGKYHVTPRDLNRE